MAELSKNLNLVINPTLGQMPPIKVEVVRATTRIGFAASLVMGAAFTLLVAWLVMLALPASMFAITPGYWSVLLGMLVLRLVWPRSNPKWHWSKRRDGEPEQG